MHGTTNPKFCHFCPILNNLAFSRQILVMNPTQKFQKNPSSGIKAVACGERNRQTDRQTDRLTDVMQLTVDFGNFAVAPKKSFIPSPCKPPKSCESTDTT
jgi:hypothetical protein